MKTFKLATPFKLHKAAGYPLLERLGGITEAESSKEELLKFHR